MYLILNVIKTDEKKYISKYTSFNVYAWIRINTEYLIIRVPHAINVMQIQTEIIRGTSRLLASHHNLTKSTKRLTLVMTHRNAVQQPQMALTEFSQLKVHNNKVKSQ